jgi:resuscitation-promoting factor RpfA
MRLVCPNCDAKYEVPEDAIPETGRDVQCANCGHAWFQMRSRAAEAAPVAAPVPPPAAPVPEPVPEPVAKVPAPAPVAEDPAPASAAEVAPEPEPVVDAAPVADFAAEEAAVEVPTVEAPVAAAIVEEAVAETVAAADASLDAALPPAEPEVVELVADIGAEAPAVAEDVVAEVAETAAAAVEADVEAPVAEDMAPAPETVAEAVSTAVADPVVTAEAAEDLVVDAAADDAVDVPASAGAIAAAGVAAYAVDESVLAILREEAERETQARKAEAAKPLETQPDLGLDASIPASRKVLETIQSDLVSGDETPDDKLSARRTRLPDVEEINSTLRPSEIAESEAEPAAKVPVVEGRSSFRSGFLLVMTVAILASALYTSADAIASVVPALAGPLKGFVSFIDSLRLNLDGLMQSATVAIGGN